MPALPLADDPLWQRLSEASPIPEVTAEEARVWGELTWPAIAEREPKRPRAMLASWWKRLNGDDLRNVRRVLANRRATELNRKLRKEAEHDGPPAGLVIPVRSIGRTP